MTGPRTGAVRCHAATDPDEPLSGALDNDGTVETSLTADHAGIASCAAHAAIVFNTASRSRVELIARRACLPDAQIAERTKRASGWQYEMATIF